MTAIIANDILPSATVYVEIGDYVKISGRARCIQWSDERIGVQFNHIGPYDTFLETLDEFKKMFTNRMWHETGWWIISAKAYPKLQQFCQHRGMSIRWVHNQVSFHKSPSQ